jgi:hypothetical protein
MVEGYSNLALPPLRVWEEEEKQDVWKTMGGFSWYLSQEEAIKRGGKGEM